MKENSVAAHNQKQTPVRTEGIKYAGSKLKIIPYIVDLLSELKDVREVLDGFSGSTRVSQAFAQLGYNTTSNDISMWSEVFATCYLKSQQPDAYYAEIIGHLNNLQGYDGWFTAHYGGEAHEQKRPFQAKNTRKLDAIRDEISRLKLPFEDECVLLTSLIYALDTVDSTLGHYASYLSDWSPRSHKDLTLKLPRRFELKSNNRVLRGDIFDCIRNNRFDFAYLDPPYGSGNEKMPPSRVRYDAYYHFWKTVICNDCPDLFGKANRREDSRDQVSASVFEEFRKDESGKHLAMNALQKLITETQARYILLSYSSGGRASREELLSIINNSGKLLRAIDIDHKHNVMANMRSTNNWINSDGKHREFLFLMEKK